MQQKRRAIEAQSEEESPEPNPESTAPPKSVRPHAQIRKAKVNSIKRNAKEAENAREKVVEKDRSKEDTHSTGVEKALVNAQEKIRAKTEKTDAMWAPIAKAVDVAMATAAPGEIKQHQIEYILKAIMVCALPQMQSENNYSSLLLSVPMPATTLSDSHMATPIQLPSKPHSWANIAARNTPPTKSGTKPSLVYK